MQTFLPYCDFDKSAKCLDRQRLGKQRSEVKILLASLTSSSGWFNHPAAKMWKGYEAALVDYGFHICDEWILRGYKDTVRYWLTDFMLAHGYDKFVAPPWLTGDDCPLCVSHRSNLLRKDPEWYVQFGWTEDDTVPYFWPVQ